MDLRNLYDVLVVEDKRMPIWCLFIRFYRARKINIEYCLFGKVYTGGRLKVKSGPLDV